MGYAERSYSYSFGGGSRSPGGGGFGGLFGSVTPWVLRLLIANGAVWLLMFVRLLPPEWAVMTFGFAPGRFLTHPWSPITYMFVHGGFLHVFFNMLVLFFFGPPLERVWGGREFLKFYLVAGLGGALASVVLLPVPYVQTGAPMVGASGAIFGVMLAFAMRWPEARVYIWGVLPMRAKWFVGLLALFTVWATFFGGGHVAHWAHLGGLVAGFAYLRWGQGLSRALDRVADGVAGAFGSDARGSGRPRPRGVPRSGSSSRGRRARGARDGRTREIPFPGSGGSDGPEASEQMLDEVDRILDKIRERGLESLTDEEREFLDEMSRRYRG